MPKKMVFDKGTSRSEAVEQTINKVVQKSSPLNSKKTAPQKSAVKTAAMSSTLSKILETNQKLYARFLAQAKRKEWPLKDMLKSWV